jgi:hypothetical protein
MNASHGAYAVNEIPEHYPIFAVNHDTGVIQEFRDEAASSARTFFRRTDEYIDLAIGLTPAAREAIAELAREQSALAFFLSADTYVLLSKNANGWEVGVNWRGSKGTRFWHQRVPAEAIADTIHNGLSGIGESIKKKRS